MTKTVKKPGNITTKKPKVKKKEESDTTLRPKTPLDFSDWSDQDYANHFQLENTLQNAVNILIKFKPDDPTKFLASYFKLTKTKEYPYREELEIEKKKQFARFYLKTCFLRLVVNMFLVGSNNCLRTSIHVG